MRQWLNTSKSGEGNVTTPVNPGVAAPLTILIVENSAMLRAMLKRVMQMSGIPIATVLEAPDRPEALDVLGRLPVDALFVSVDSPVAEGMELLRAVQSHGEWSAVVRVATGTTTAAALHDELAALRVRGVLETPFRSERVRELLWDLVAGVPESERVH